MTDAMKNGRLFPLLEKAGTICFVGDSLTEGTMNGGVPWYEPFRSGLPGRIVNISMGGATSESLLAFFRPTIARARADLYVVAIGANDILFRDPMSCAVTAEAYVENLSSLRGAVMESRPDAKLVFIAPWPPTDGDAALIGGALPADTDAAYRGYTSALEAWCAGNGDVFINANETILREIALKRPGAYLVDFIHPNAGDGVRLYAEAVLMN